MMAMLCTFLLQVTASHALTPYEFGFFAKWLTDINLFGIFFVLGLDNALLFFTKKREDFYYNLTSNLKVIFSLVFFAFVLVSLIGDDLVYYYYLLVAVLMVGLFQYFNAYNQIEERFGVYGFANFLKSFFILVPFLVLAVVGEGGDHYQAALMYIYGLLVSLVFLVVFFLKKGGRVLCNSKVSFEYLKYGFRSMSNTLLAVVLYSVSVYCMEFWSSKELLGVFFLAASISKLAWILPDVAGNILYPRFIKEEVGSNKVMGEAHLYGGLILYFNLILAALFFIFGRVVIEFFFSPEFNGMYWPILVLLIGNQGMVFYKILGRYLASENNWVGLRLGLIAGIAANVLCNFYLIPTFSVLGAALSTAISFWVCGLVVAFFVKGSLKGFLYGGISNLIRDRYA